MSSAVTVCREYRGMDDDTQNITVDGLDTAALWSQIRQLQQERDAAREDTQALWRAMKQYVDASGAFNAEAVRLYQQGVGIHQACHGLRLLAREEKETFADLCRLVLEHERKA